jgi:hypothetical protein
VAQLQPNWQHEDVLLLSCHSDWTDCSSNRYADSDTVPSKSTVVVILSCRFSIPKRDWCFADIVSGDSFWLVCTQSNSATSILEICSVPLPTAWAYVSLCRSKTPLLTSVIEYRTLLLSLR